VTPRGRINGRLVISSGYRSGEGVGALTAVVGDTGSGGEPLAAPPRQRPNRWVQALQAGTQLVAYHQPAVRAQRACRRAHVTQRCGYQPSRHFVGRPLRRTPRVIRAGNPLATVRGAATAFSDGQSPSPPLQSATERPCRAQNTSTRSPLAATSRFAASRLCVRPTSSAGCWGTTIRATSPRLTHRLLMQRNTRPDSRSRTPRTPLKIFTAEQVPTSALS